jgi:hypothetical protein
MGAPKVWPSAIWPIGVRRMPANAPRTAEGYEATIPTGGINSLDGGPARQSLSCELYVEPALLRFAEARPESRTPYG